MAFDALADKPSSSEAPSIFYSISFRNEIEANLSYLKKTANEQTLVVEQQKAYKYTGDLIGLLISEGVPASHQWAMIRMNGYLCASDYDGEKVEFITPATPSITNLQRRFKTLYTFDI